jgi:CHAD domain-containing protein
MPFRIRPDHHLTDEFRRAAAGHLREAIDIIEERPNGTHEAIHDFRKNLKRVRSLYRLVARDIPAFRERENARLRDVAKSVSTIRDAAALIDTAVYLKENARDAEEGETLDRIVSALEMRRDRMLGAAESGLEQRLSEIPGMLGEAIAALDTIEFNGRQSRNARLIAKGWRKTVRGAQKAIASCHDEASAETFHTLRKRTQDYRAYHTLLRPLWPTAMKAKYEAASQLVDLLGHVHDLDVLCELVEAEPHFFPSADDLARLLDAIIFRQQEDRNAALDRAEDVFPKDYDKEADRIALLWRAVANRDDPADCVRGPKPVFPAA